MAGNPSVPAAWCGIEPDADSGGGNQIRNALRTGAATVAGMNDHLHTAGLLEHLKSDAPTPKKVWEAIQTLFAAINEVQDNVTSRFGTKTKVAFTTSPGYASMPPALQFVYAILILIAEGNA